jgi:hypothetical protein
MHEAPQLSLRVRHIFILDKECDMHKVTMDIAIAISIFLATILFSNLGIAEESPSHTLTKPFMKNINFKVQLKENEWVKLVEEKYTETTREELNKTYGIDTHPLNKGDVERLLFLKAQFLRPCKATSKSQDIILDPNLPDPILRERFIEATKFENSVLKYKCDYRTTVFVTFYSKDGNELETKGLQPVAPQEKHTNSYKIEILPGETASLLFFIPKNAFDWYAWVPK